MQYSMASDINMPNPSRRVHRRKKSNHNPWQTPSNSVSYIIDTQGIQQDSYHHGSLVHEPNDGTGSLTYSASSSQAGESTDSSIADLSQLDRLLENINDPTGVLEREHQHHLHEQQSALKRKLSRSDSMSTHKGTFATTGQPSDSYAHDGGASSRSNKIISTPNMKGNSRSRSYSRSQTNISPATVSSTDVSVSSAGGNTPSTPPPRYVKRTSTIDSKNNNDKEYWYAKWWMCGFPDVLNLNGKW